MALPRIALYQSWVPSMDEGWTRYIFDQNGIPYKRLVDADIRKGNLNDRFDVIVLPDNSARAITTGRGGYGEDSGEPAPPPVAGSGGPGRADRAAQDDQSRGQNRGPSIPPEFTGGLGDGDVGTPIGPAAAKRQVKAQAEFLGERELPDPLLRNLAEPENVMAPDDAEACRHEDQQLDHTLRGRTA